MLTGSVLVIAISMFDAGLESVARDAAVGVSIVADPRSAQALLGHGLQRLYEPLREEQPERFAHLLAAIERALADGPK